MSRRDNRSSDRSQTLLFERSAGSSGAAEAWTRFGKALAGALANLQEDEFLIIMRKRTNYFIQFDAQGSFGMRIEAVSNHYQPRYARLPERAVRTLERLGWLAPTYIPAWQATEPIEGSSNFYLDVASPVPVREISDLAIETLRGVYGVRHPGELEYDATSMDGGSIRFPSLGIRRRSAPRTSPHINELDTPTQQVLQIVMPPASKIC